MSIRSRLFLIRFTLIWKLRLTIRKLGFGYCARAVRLQSCLWWNLKYQLRLLDDSSYSEGFDPTFDKIVHLAAVRLTTPHAFDEKANELFSIDPVPRAVILDENERKTICREYYENRQAIHAFLERFGDSREIAVILSKYFQVNGSIQNYFGNNNARDYYMKCAKAFDSNVLNLDIYGVRNLLRKSRRDLKHLKTSISDRQALRISLPTRNIPTVLSVISTLFLISGYLYSRALLGHFGIEVDKFFLLSDYISASIEGISYSIFATISGAIGVFLGRHSVSRMSYLSFAQHRIPIQIQYYSFVTIFGFTAIVAYLRNLESAYFLGAMAILFLSSRPIIWVVRRYVKDEDQSAANFVTFSILVFFLHLFVSVGVEIHKIKHGTISDLKQYNTSFKEATISENTTILLAANSRYLFLRDMVNGTVHIVPVSQVQDVSVRH